MLRAMSKPQSESEYSPEETTLRMERGVEAVPEYTAATAWQKSIRPTAETQAAALLQGPRPQG